MSLPSKDKFLSEANPQDRTAGRVLVALAVGALIGFMVSQGISATRITMMEATIELYRDRDDTAKGLEEVAAGVKRIEEELRIVKSAVAGDEEALKGEGR